MPPGYPSCPAWCGSPKSDRVASRMPSVSRHLGRAVPLSTRRATSRVLDTDPALPPMGLRVRLKADVDISGYPYQARVVLRALKEYGMILADNGSPWYVTGAPHPRWNDDALHALHGIKGSDLEVVDTTACGAVPDVAPCGRGAMVG